MNAIVIICGGNSCGKTTTIRKFFQGRVSLTVSGKEFFERTFDGKRIYAIDSGSPQERNRFCRVERVNKNIQDRIDECNEKADRQSYILIIPFTMSVSNADRTKLNEDCILKPIEELKKAFNVFVIYLKKTNAQNRAEKDALMKRIATAEIETTKQDCDKSAELETFLRKEVIQTLA
jgi:GTPase SAR1 family protein